MNLGKWIGLIVFGVSLYILWEIRQVVLLGFTAMILASGLNSLVTQLTKVGVKRNLAIAIAVFGIIGLALLVGLLVIPPFVAQSQEFIELIPKTLERFDQVMKWLVSEQINGSPIINPQLIEDAKTQLPSLVGPLFKNFFSLFSNSLLVLLNILLILVLSVMFLIEPDRYRRIWVQLFPAFYRRRADAITQQCERVLDRWMGGILFNMLVIGIFSGLGLWFLRVKLVLANAIIAGLLEAIPNIGPTLSVLPPIAIALLDSPWKALAVLVFYVLLQQLEQYLLVPTVMAKQVDLLPAITLLSQIIFSLFFGFLGLLLALPLILVGQIWLKEVLVKDILDHWHHPKEGPKFIKNEA